MSVYTERLLLAKNDARKVENMHTELMLQPIKRAPNPSASPGCPPQAGSQRAGC